MIPFRATLFCSVFFVSLAGTAPVIAAPASLAWETPEQSVAAKPGQESVAVVYPFRNVADHAVRIVSIESGCSCTAATTDKNEFAAGERGELKVKFVLGGRVGRQERVITVVTDDATAPRSIVKLNVDIPELATIRPRLLFWSVGAKPETKTAEIALTFPETSRLETPQPSEA
jgi:hypothetical protein